MNNYYTGSEMKYGNGGASFMQEATMKVSENDNVSLNFEQNMNIDPNKQMQNINMCCEPQNICCEPQNVCCEPICECPQEQECHRYINYEVPHIMPCHTKVINHHVYRHTFKPYYTCCEENVVCNVYDNKCC